MTAREFSIMALSAITTCLWWGAFTINDKNGAAFLFIGAVVGSAYFLVRIIKAMAD